MAKPAKPNKKISARAIAKPITASTVSFTNFNFDKWFPFFIAAFGFLLYINTLTHGYVLDDNTVMAKNSIVIKGIKAIPEIMTTAYRKGAWLRQESLYRPLSLVMFAIEWQIAPNVPFFGHLINVLLYALTGFFLYKLLRKWFHEKHSFVVCLMTLLFIAHPLHTEVIANIKSRDEILGLLFSILSLNAFYEYASNNSIKNLLFGALYFFLAILSKESTITLFAGIPLSVFFFAKPEDNKKYAFVMTGLLVSFIIYFILRKIAIGGLVTFAKVDVLNNSLVATDNKLERFATAIVLVGYYIRLFFFPHPLSFDYSLNTIPNATFSDIRFLISAVIIIALAVYAIINLKKRDAIGFGILFFVITLSIVSNIFVIIEATLAERFMYIPSLGLCIAVIIALERILKFAAKDNFSFSSTINQNKVFSFILLVILVLFSIKTFTRNLDWKDNFTLFSVDKEHNPNSYRNLSGYVGELYTNKILPLKDGDPQKLEYCRESVGYLTKSLSITEDNFSSWNLLAYCYSQLHDYKNGQYVFETGIKYYKPEDLDLDKFYMMGSNAYYYSGNLSKALETFKAGLAISDTNASLWNSYGMILTEVNDLKNAKDALIKSLELDSTQADTWYNMGNWYAKNADYISAINAYNRVEKLNAALLTAVNSYNNTGSSYGALRQFDKALEYYQKALALNPTSKEALKNIVLTYTNLGNTAKAQEYNTKLQSLP